MLGQPLLPRMGINIILSLIVLICFYLTYDGYEAYHLTFITSYVIPFSLHKIIFSFLTIIATMYFPKVSSKIPY